MRGLLLGSLLLGLAASYTHAQWGRVAVRAYGTNALALTAAGLQTNTHYAVIVRSNGPFSTWLPLTEILSDTNTTVTLHHDLASAEIPELRSLTPGTLSHWTFCMGPAGDRDQDGLADYYEDLVSRTDPYDGNDGYSDPDGDGWVNLQEMQSGTNPLRWNAPPRPGNLAVAYSNGTARVTWNQGHLPDYFLVLKSLRTLKTNLNTRPGPFLLQPPADRSRTNMEAYWRQQREIQRRYAPEYNRRYRPEYETNAPEVIAKIIPKPGQHDFSFIDSNAPVTVLTTPLYQLDCHFAPRAHAGLRQVSPDSIRQAALRVNSMRSTNGFSLSVAGSRPHARYLLLVRDRSNPTWRASGYFVGGDVQVRLDVNSSGMMREGQAPIAMPRVRFAPAINEPEFLAGYGEDSDGDGLPDIYELMVTETDPTFADTGRTGVLDSYKDFDGDEFVNLEEFRRRTNPFQRNERPETVELMRPTAMELWKALNSERLATDLPLEPEVLIRKPGEPRFMPGRLDWMAVRLAGAQKARLDMDIRVIWRVPRPGQLETGYSGP